MDSFVRLVITCS